MERSRLAQLRAKKHWTLEEASERIGVSVNTLNRWEHGIQSPHGYNVQRLCDAYSITEAEALGRPIVLDAPTAGLVSMPPLTELWADDLLAKIAVAELRSDPHWRIFTKGITWYDRRRRKIARKRK